MLYTLVFIHFNTHSTLQSYRKYGLHLHLHLYTQILLHIHSHLHLYSHIHLHIQYLNFSQPYTHYTLHYSCDTAITLFLYALNYILFLNLFILSLSYFLYLFLLSSIILIFIIFHIDTSNQPSMDYP